MSKKIIILSLGLLTSNISSAKDMFAGDIVGRELNSSGLKWAGHVALATSETMNTTAYLVIEALDTSPHIQLNSISQFKQMSPYWGSRYGIGDYAQGTRNALIEASNQRWWCPKYTIFPTYTIGDGNLLTGKATRCGEWRCDTFVAYSYMHAGYPQLIGFLPTILPKRVFSAFPYANSQLLPEDNIVNPYESDKDFNSVKAEELNQMSLEELQAVAVLPVDQETPQHIRKEWILAKSNKLKNIYRGFFIDGLTRIKSNHTIPKFIKMYDDETDNVIKDKIIGATMIYYQSNVDIDKSSDDRTLLINFYKKLLDTKLNPEAAHDVVRGYVDLNPPEDVLSNTKLINKQFDDIEPHLLLGLKMQLAHKSIELERIYIPSITKMLTHANSSDLDEMFFGITKLSYKHLRDPVSLHNIKAYMDSVSTKYSAPAISSSKDVYFGVAAESFRSLRDEI